MIIKYMLAKASIRNIVNLEDYQKIIKHALVAVNPEVEVTVQKDCYLVYGNLMRGQAIKAGKLIGKSSLGRYAVKYPINSKRPSTVQIFKGKKIM